MWKLAGGYDWEPSSYDTFEEALEEALEEASDMQPFVITELKLLPPE
jgi:hypothetical protein